MSYELTPPTVKRPLRERVNPNPPITLGGRQTPVPPAATAEQWRAAYDAKVAEFAAETRRCSDLQARVDELVAANADLVILLHRGKIDQSSWPAHLRDDAPSQRCDRCGRNTWAVEEFGNECRMTQPSGKPCGGRFGA